VIDSNASETDANDSVRTLTADLEQGRRHPAGGVGRIILALALAWSLFQLWIASPLPFALGRLIPILNDTESRSIHLAIAIFLTFLAFPATSKSIRARVPFYDWGLAFIGAFCAGYHFLFYEQLAGRPGLPTATDLISAGIGLIILLEAARRALGPALTVVALIFLTYVFFGDQGFIPDVVRWKGASLERALSHQWLTTQGVFGIALGVSTGFVFLFVLFGALLEAAGAGHYFIKLAFALLGHLRGGPAKAAVLGSAVTGLISGSSIANVVTTGTFTIPLMRRVGFSPEKAGSIEVASSVNGQLTPPVMGAAAFLIMDSVGITYTQVITHALLPAVISYIALVYIVHLEAMKQNMRTLPKPPGPARSVLQTVTGLLLGFGATALVFGCVYIGVDWAKTSMGGWSGPVVAIGAFAAYVVLLRRAARAPDLPLDDPDREDFHLPDARQVAPTGLYYVLPLVVLVWFLVIERVSPGLAAFWACIFLTVILLTQKPLKVFFRGDGDGSTALTEGWHDLLAGLITGARNMIGIAVATATAGIIVGTVTLTGIGQVMAEFVEFISGGVLIFMLIWVAIISLILGMGLPTTANYIVVSSLMAGVVVELGAQNGLIVPLIAVHMFVFYFGIMADVTPPVGLASFAAAAVSGGDPIRTGVIAFGYSLRTVLLPFLFIFNTDLLLIDVTLWKGLLIFCIASIAMLAFAAATQGYFIVRSRLWESAALLLVAFTLLRPGFWLDSIHPPYDDVPQAALYEVIANQPSKADIRIRATGETIEGDLVTRSFLLPLGTASGAAATDGQIRLLKQAGLALRFKDDLIFVDDLAFNGPAEAAGLDFGWQVVKVGISANRWPKEVFFGPALILLILVFFLQNRRKSYG
jgi:TRAP transporter 4TM/12TM fusion protein